MKVMSIFLFMILVGCGSPAEPEVDEAEAEDRETVFDPLVESLDKAKGVEDIVMQQKRDMDAALQRMDDEEQDSEE